MIHFALLVAGLTYLLTQSAFFVPYRMLFARGGPVFETFVYCPSCTGFWVGVVLHTLWPYPEVLFIPAEAGIGACAMMAVWTYYVPSKTWEIEQGRDGEEATEET